MIRPTSIEAADRAFAQNYERPVFYGKKLLQSSGSATILLRCGMTCRICPPWAFPP